MGVKRTIVAAGEGMRYEGEAVGVVSPGDLCMKTSADKVQRHATAGGKTGALFAIENELFGRGTDVDYAVGDRVLMEHCTTGMIVNVNLAANAAAIVIGDQLESKGDGNLRKLTTGTPIAEAIEAVDNSASASKTRISVRII